MNNTQILHDHTHKEFMVYLRETSIKYQVYLGKVIVILIRNLLF